MLLPHTKNIHGVNVKVKYSSVYSVNIRGMFCLGLETQLTKIAVRRPSPAATGKTDVIFSNIKGIAKITFTCRNVTNRDITQEH